LWNDPSKTADAAAALKMTGNELLKLGVVDEVIPEPLGGAHRDLETTADRLAQSLQRQLKQLEKIPLPKLVKLRYEKYRKMAAFAST